MWKQCGSRSALALLFVAALLAGGHGSAGRTSGAAYPPGKSPAETLIALNTTSRAAYAAWRAEALADCGPVVLLDGDVVALEYGVFRQRVRYMPDLYHTLKTVGHVPLAVYALLVRHTGGELADKRLFDLARYRRLVRTAGPALEKCPLTKDQLARQKKILAASTEFLGGVLKHRRVQAKGLLAYVRRTRPLLDANTAEAARAQIDALHRQMSAWRRRLTEKEWKSLKVIVMGMQMPRKDNLAVQYFARLLGEKGEGARIIYAESIADERKALNLLGTHLVDTRIGSDFFNDPLYMHRDLLRTAAREYLDELFKKARP
jgi:hypothetical protein